MVSENRTIFPVDQTIYNTLSVNNALVQNELAEIVFNTNNVRLSRSTISRKIKKIGFSRKKLSLVPAERNTEEKISTRAIYANDILNIPDSNLILLDETGFNEHTHRGYGYSQINSKAFITVSANKGINRSLVCVIGSEGVIAYSFKVGSYNSESFKDFLDSKLIPYFRANPNKILIMDVVSPRARTINLITT